MALSETVGLYIIAPALSTITAGFLFWFGKTHLKTIRTLDRVELRQQNHAEDIEDNSAEIKQLKQMVKS